MNFHSLVPLQGTLYGEENLLLGAYVLFCVFAVF